MSEYEHSYWYCQTIEVIKEAHGSELCKLHSKTDGLSTEQIWNIIIIAAL